jgi:hypothetical protein
VFKQNETVTKRRSSSSIQTFQSNQREPIITSPESLSNSTILIPDVSQELFPILDKVREIERERERGREEERGRER